MMSQEQCNLYHHINAVSFALIDVSLFLDTHPDCQEALDHYRMLRDQRQCALKEYSRKFGPLLMDQVEAKDYWTWVETPWPWEM